MQLARGCTELRVLAANNTEMTNTALLCVSTSSKALQRLEISHNSSVSDDGLLAILHGCPKLEALNLSYLQISDYVLSTACCKCKTLKSIDISGCLSVTGAAISRLENEFPRVTIIDRRDSD